MTFIWDKILGIHKDRSINLSYVDNTNLDLIFKIYSHHSHSP